MKRSILFILMIVIGLSAFSQSPSRSICMRPAYPLVIGDNTVDSVEITNNGLYMYDIIQDSLPVYQIGAIQTQTIRYSSDGVGFYVQADTLHSNRVVYSYNVVEGQPEGTIEFNTETGRFKYYPTVDEYKPFRLTFSASNGQRMFSETVAFSLMPPLVDEEYVIKSKGTMPAATDYIVIGVDSASKVINYQERMAYEYSLSGKDIVFDNDVANKVWGLSGRADIYELNIYAETLRIRSALSFPQTNITIYAKELIFEDHDNIVASISTTPVSIGAMTGEVGTNGIDAGNITLYVNQVKGGTAKRFLLNGGKGQSSSREGAPGNGGNGGVMSSTVDVYSNTDFLRGSSGVKFDRGTDEAGTNGNVIATGNIGMAGRYETIHSPYAYLHPNYVGAAIRHAKDAYINEKTHEAYEILNNYCGLIEDYMSNGGEELTNSEVGLELESMLPEINNELCKLEQGLDYFGNPKGWVPLLSFEVMLNNYNSEIERAIPTLYMYYWLNHIDQTLEHKIQAHNLMASETEKEIQNSVDQINSWVLLIPVLQDKAAEIQIKIDSLHIQIDKIEAHLLSKARHNVKKRNRIKKAASICKTVSSAISVCGPWGAAIGSALNVVSSVATKVGEASKKYGLTDVATICDNINFSWNKDDSIAGYKYLANTIKDGLGSVGSLDLKGIKTAYKNIKNKIDPLLDNIKETSNLISHGSITDENLRQEFDRLCAENPEWNRIKAEIEELDKEKQSFLMMVVGLNNNIGESTASVNSNLIKLDENKRGAFVGNSKRDLNAKLYMEKMEQNAKARLLKYHYYLRKAYEYRLLKPYEGEFNLVAMFERFEKMGMALGDVIDETAYKTLGSIFKTVVSDMAEEIIDEYSVNYPEQSAPITIVIPKEQLDMINANDSYILNFYDMGIFSPDEDNIRIVNLGIQHIETHVDGKVGYSGYMDLNMTHDGISKFRKDGQIYWFDHKSRSTTSPHTWGLRYDAVTNEKTTIQPSAASASLLASIIGNNDIMLFSRPSAWGNITLSKKTHTSGGADIVIDSLVIRLQYDFTRRPNKLRNIDITTSDDLMPYIACSDEDVSGKRDGNGSLYRSYDLSNQPVTFTALKNYGVYEFKNWTDRSGRIVSEDTKLSIRRNADQFYRANYELMPLLEGDVNEDMRVDISDIVAIINVIAGRYSYENEDVNSDGRIDISDIVRVINIIAE